jgi:protein-S-isoprenylcysteine O-methyltransferase Ste14
MWFNEERGVRRLVLSVALAALNAGLLTIPRLIAGPGHQWTFATFLALVSIFCFAEAGLVDEVPRGPRNLATLATMTGLAVFGVFVTAILTEGQTSHDGMIVVCGAVLMASGVVLRCLAIYTLGPRFVSELRVPPGQPLVRTGVYRWLDHPSEAGLLALTAGAAILFRSVDALLVWALVLAPLTFARVRAENAFLRTGEQEVAAGERGTEVPGIGW